MSTINGVVLKNMSHNGQKVKNWYHNGVKVYSAEVLVYQANYEWSDLRRIVLLDEPVQDTTYVDSTAIHSKYIRGTDSTKTYLHVIDILNLTNQAKSDFKTATVTIVYGVSNGYGDVNIRCNEDVLYDIAFGMDINTGLVEETITISLEERLDVEGILKLENLSSADGVITYAAVAVKSVVLNP
jgi:hypothetical protein